MSFHDTVKNLNKLQATQVEAKEALATALTEKIKSVPIDEITQEIKRKSNSDAVRMSIIMQCESNGISIDKDNFAQMLSDEKESVGLKVFLIGELSSGDEKYSKIIENFLQSENDSLWGKALYEQVYSSPKNAGLIADSVLNAFDGTITVRYRKSLGIKALLATQSKKPEDYAALVELCKKTISEANNRDNAISATADALFDAPSIETLRYVFSQGSPFNEEYKHPIAFENEQVIKSLFAQEATVENASLLSNVLGFTGDAYNTFVKQYITDNADFFNINSELLSVFSSYIQN